MKNYSSIAGLIFIAVSLNSFAQGSTSDANTDANAPMHHWDHKDHMGHPVMELGDGQQKMEEALHLTDAQKKALADLRSKAEPEHKALHEKMKEAHEALRKADDDQADEATLKKLANNLANLLAQQELLRIKDHRAFVAQLTPEQKQTLQQLKKDHPMHDHFKQPNP